MWREGGGRLQKFNALDTRGRLLSTQEYRDGEEGGADDLRNQNNAKKIGIKMLHAQNYL